MPLPRRLRFPLAGIAALTVSAAAPSPLAPADTLRGPVDAEVLRVVDGDTVLVTAHIWLGQRVETLVRLAGIDTPELRGRCDDEKALAQRARSLVETRLPPGARVRLHDVSTGKFAGRIVARLFTEEGEDIGRTLIDSGLARPYDGGRRAPWCGA